MASMGAKTPKEEEERAAKDADSLVSLGREECGVLERAEQREWLATNGLGGYATGTVSGNLTRRYHGLLVAALNPPDRTLLVSKIEEIVSGGGSECALATNRWASGAVEPKGYSYIENFRLEGAIPVWRFAMGKARLEKRIWMQQGEETTYVRYRLAQADSPVELNCKVLVNYRDYHSTTHAGNWRMGIERVAMGAKVEAFHGAVPFYLLSNDASCEIENEWYRDFYLLMENERGLEDREDQLFAATFHAQLEPGQSATMVFSTNPGAELDGDRALEARREHQKALLANWLATEPRAAACAPGWIRQLVLAADQFVIRRRLPDESEGRSIIAGYHWFCDWGRDAMVSLPGLLLKTGRAEIAKNVLQSFARYIEDGILPNNFADAGGKAEYNTVDAALWFVEAVRHYFEATGDTATLRALYPSLLQVMNAYSRGTRYNIHADEADGLLFAGESGVQLTWMDAKIGDHVVTPRIGKPVEVNALWYNAHRAMEAMAASAGESDEAFARAAERIRASFGRFWNAPRNCCHDVIDVPGSGNDGTLRPNQIFAVSLRESPLSAEQQKAVVDICLEKLYTPFGLRSLAPEENDYHGQYAGGQAQRDGAYHQGTAWGWLLGSLALAHYRVYKDKKRARSFLEPLAERLGAAGLGTLNEISDGDSPFSPRGCIAQAWSVGEALRAWHELQD